MGIYSDHIYSKEVGLYKDHIICSKVVGAV